MERSVVEAFTTVTIPSECHQARGFTYGVGNPIEGVDYVAATLADTNLREFCTWPTKARWVGLDWTIPLAVPQRFLGRYNGLGDYPITAKNLREFARATVTLRVNDRTVLEYPIWSVGIKRTDFGTSQRLVFAEPVQLRSEDRFYLEVTWNGTSTPTFDPHPKNSSCCGPLIAVFRLLEHIDGTYVSEELPASEDLPSSNKAQQRADELAETVAKLQAELGQQRQEAWMSLNSLKNRAEEGDRKLEETLKARKELQERAEQLQQQEQRLSAETQKVATEKQQVLEKTAQLTAERTRLEAVVTRAETLRQMGELSTDIDCQRFKDL